MEEIKKLTIPEGYEFDRVEYDEETDSYKPKKKE